MERTFPAVSPALVEALEELFPDRCPKLHASDREVWYHAGEAHVVEFLRMKLEEQKENIQIT